MTTETILKPIWNWQITIPQEWRIFLNIDKKNVKASLVGGKVIIEAIEPNLTDRDVKKINLTDLWSDLQKQIKQSHKHYRTKNKSAFISHETARENA